MIDNTSEKTEWRLSSLERATNDMSITLSNIQTIITQLNSKIPAAGLNCPIHTLRMDTFDKRMNDVETEVKSITKKIITWSAIAGCVIFILTNLVFPFILQNLKIGTTSANAAVVPMPTNGPFYFQTWATNKDK